MKPSIEMAKKGEIIQASAYSTVIRGSDGWIYKVSTDPLFTWVEFTMLGKMLESIYVPVAMRLSSNVLAVEDLGDKEESWGKVTDKAEFVAHGEKILAALKEAGIRHGDLTKHNIIVRDNIPMVIDFAESKLWDDPALDKRPGGDSVWLRAALLEIADGIA